MMLAAASEDDGGDNSSGGSSSDSCGPNPHDEPSYRSHRSGGRDQPPTASRSARTPVGVKNKARPKPAQDGATSAGRPRKLSASAVRTAASQAKKPRGHRDSQPPRKAAQDKARAAAMGREHAVEAAHRASGRVASYGALASAKGRGGHAAAAGKSDETELADTTWQSTVDKWRQDVGGVGLTPRAKHARPSKVSYSDHSTDETDSDSTSSTSSSSTLSSGSPPSSGPALTRKLGATAATRSALLSGSKNKRALEKVPLLQPLQASKQADLELGEVATDDVAAVPNTKEELVKICRLSYPVIFTYLLEVFPAMISMTLVGHMDSPLTNEYVDGVSFSGMVMNLTGVAFGFGLATAMDTLCSQAYGAGKSRMLGIYFQSGVIVLGLTVLPVFIFNWFTTDLLLWMKQPEEVAILAGQFTQIQLFGIPFMYAYELFKKVLQAQNIVMPMVYIAVFSNVVNLVLGFYLTFYTPLGFIGAAIARCASNMVLPLALIPYFLWNPSVLHRWWPGWQLSEAVAYIRPFLELGVPGMFMMLLEWWSFEIMAIFVGLLPNSVVAISVHSVLVNVSNTTFDVFLGISVATNVLVGNYVGGNKPLHAKMAAKLGMILSVSASVLLMVAIVASRFLLPAVFVSDDTSIALAAHALLFLMPYQMCDSINCVMQGIFRGTRRQKFAAYLNLVSYFVLGLPFGLYLAFPLGWGIEGMWLGLTAGIFFGCVISFVKILRTNWYSTADAARIASM